MLEISVRESDGKERKIECEKDSVMIGRGSGNDVQLEVVGVSRYHARLTLDGDALSIQDLDSTNGTFVNSTRVTEQVLKPGDKISIGNAVLQVTVVPDSEILDSSYPTIDQNQKPLTKDVELRVAETKPAQKAPDKVEEKRGPTGKNAEAEFYWQSMASFLGPVWPYIMDDSVTEVLVNGPDQIYIERKGHLEHVPAKFNPDQLRAAVLNIAQFVGRRASEDEPYLDARLPDGSRVAVLLPPCSRKGVSVSIRKFAKERLTLNKLMEFGSLNQPMITFLKAVVGLKKNIIVSGGTSSGKTSLLNVVSGLIPDDERILTIEDSAELQLSQDHVLPMETKPADKKGRGEITIRDLVKASLRMRPDRIVVGEIRSGEALDLLQAMNTGHSGSMATVHASSPPQALTRLETLALFSGIEIPMRALREQVSTAIDIVIQASRLPDHSRKVTHISEVGRLNDDGTYQVHDIYRFNNEGRTSEGKIKGQHVWTKHIPSSLDEMELSGFTDAVALFK